MSTVNTELFTKELINDSIGIISEYGVKAVSIFCKSATGGSVVGSKNLGAMSSTPLNISQNQTITFASQTNGVLVGLTILSPASCTLQIIAQL